VCGCVCVCHRAREERERQHCHQHHHTTTTTKQQYHRPPFRPARHEDRRTVNWMTTKVPGKRHTHRNLQPNTEKQRQQPPVTPLSPRHSIMTTARTKQQTPRRRRSSELANVDPVRADCLRSLRVQQCDSDPLSQPHTNHQLATRSQVHQKTTHTTFFFVPFSVSHRSSEVLLAPQQRGFAHRLLSDQEQFDALPPATPTPRPSAAGTATAAPSSS